MLVAAPQLVLNNPGGGYEAEAADGHQGGGQEHPEAAHAAEHGGSGLGQRTRGQTQTDPEFFFLLPAQEPMHLELASFKSETLTCPLPSVRHYMSNKQESGQWASAAAESPGHLKTTEEIPPDGKLETR